MDETKKGKGRSDGIVPVMSTPFRSSTRELPEKTIGAPNVQGIVDTQEPCLCASGTSKHHGLSYIMRTVSLLCGLKNSRKRGERRSLTWHPPYNCAVRPACQRALGIPAVGWPRCGRPAPAHQTDRAQGGAHQSPVATLLVEGATGGNANHEAEMPW